MLTQQRTVTDFFINDKPAWAVYDATRKLPSFIDGLKNSQRKLLWTGFDKLQKDYCKTETLCNICSLDTAYIHGAANLVGVCDTLTQNFVGACNYPYFLGNDGGWGSRMVPRSAAGRYTKVKLSNISKVLFNPIDNQILERQYFEGQYIEPKYLVPIFPTLFLNLSNGLTAGFSENIYSRNPKQIIKWIRKKLNSEKVPDDLPPWFKGYNGEIRFNKDQNMYESVGRIKMNNMTSYTITEIPVETTYQKYIEFLDKLEEDKVIQNYEDRCNPRTNEILFEIKTTRDFTRKHNSEESLLKVFKLVKSLPEQYNCIDEDGRVVEFENISQILCRYFEIRFELYTRRRKHILEGLKNDLEKLVSKYLFCKGIIEKTLVVSNRKRADIEADLEKIEKIIKVDGSYDYLLRNPISQITLEEMDRLKAAIKGKKDEFLQAKAKTEKDMWNEDLDKLEKEIRQ